MQRRAAAIYFAIFVLLGAGAFTFIQVGMTKPHVDLDGPTYSQGDQIQVGDRTYNVSNLEASAGGGGGGGHGGGGGGGITHSGELTWYNDSAVATAELAANDTIDYRDGQYRVAIENGSDGFSFTLVESFNVSQMLANDPDVENETATQGGEEYVFYTNGTRQLLSEYLPEPDTAGPFSQGDTLQYTPENETVDATVRSVTAEAATLTWPAPGNETIEFEGGANVTLNDRVHFVHFVSNDSVQILPADQYYQAYQGELADIHNWESRRMGLWATVFLTFIGGAILFMSALMPVKG